MTVINEFSHESYIFTVLDYISNTDSNLHRLGQSNQRNLKWCSGSWASQNRQKEKSQSKVGHLLNVDLWEVLWLPGQNLSGSNVRSNN